MLLRDSSALLKVTSRDFRELTIEGRGDGLSGLRGLASGVALDLLGEICGGGLGGSESVLGVLLGHVAASLELLVDQDVRAVELLINELLVLEVDERSSEGGGGGQEEEDPVRDVLDEEVAEEGG